MSNYLLLDLIGLVDSQYKLLEGCSQFLAWCVQKTHVKLMNGWMHGWTDNRQRNANKLYSQRKTCFDYYYGDDNDDKQNYFVSLLITKEIF